MPYDNVPEPLWDKMDRCVEQVQGEGKSKEAAVAICYASIVEGKAIDAGFILPPSLADETIYIGDTVKALGNGKVGGYLIRFTKPGDVDAVGDYFDAKTDLRRPATLDVLYHHGMDAKVGKRVIGKGGTRADEVGLWIDAQLDMRDGYEKAIYQLAQEGKLGWSSGAIGHLVEREPVGKSMYIKTWAIGEASLTPTPAEYRNSAVPLKSLSTSGTLVSEDNIQSQKGQYKMDEIQTAVKAALEAERAAQKAEADRQAEIKAAADLAYANGLKDAQNVKKAPVVVTELGKSDDGMAGFRHYIKTGQINGDLIPEAKAAMAIGAGGTGGYLVPDPLYAQIIAKRDISSWVRQAPVTRFTTPADHLLVPTEDTSMTAFVSTAEAVAYNENEPTVAQVDMVNTKYTKVIKASEEFVNYEGTNFDSWLAEALGRAEAATENTAASAVLVAGATSSGITTASATAVTIPELASVAGALGGGYEAQGQTGWLMKNASLWYLKGVFGTNYYSFDGLFNKPAWVSDDLDAIAASKKPIFYGNWNMFGMVERPGMTVRRNEALYMLNGQIGIFANIYRGFAVLQSEGIVYLNTHA